MVGLADRRLPPTGFSVLLRWPQNGRKDAAIFGGLPDERSGFRTNEADFGRTEQNDCLVGVETASAEISMAVASSETCRLVEYVIRQGQRPPCAGVVDSVMPLGQQP